VTDVKVEELRQWHVWNVLWTHEDKSYYECSEHPAVIISSAKHLADEPFVRLIKLSGSDTKPPGALCLRVTDPPNQYIHLSKDSYVHAKAEQHLHRTKPPLLSYRGGPVSAATEFYLKVAIKNVGLRAPYAIPVPPKQAAATVGSSRS